MLESKVKVKKETVQVYEALKNETFGLPKIQEIEDRRLVKQSITVIYSTLINYSAPITLKISALLFLKKLFQTANPQVIQEAEKIVPILIETTLSTVNQQDPGALYFVLNELRPINETELSKKYVRFSMQILKQWGEYMIDLREQSSPYVSWFRSCEEQKAPFPSYFLYFTMKDYIEFMLNWNNRKRKNQFFQDKIEIYHFLTNPDSYNKNLHYYKNNLSENSYIIVYQTYSILISHSIPVSGKLQVLQSMKDLYQEGNLIYSNKIEDMVLPYFQYFVDLLSKNLQVDRYFEIIEYRLGIDPMDSRKYVYTILQLIDQWNKYNMRSPINPFATLAQKINRSGLLRNVSSPLYQPQDINRYLEKISIGKHRQPEYIIPPPKKASAEMEVEYRNRIQDYERKINDLMREQERYKAEIISYTKMNDQRNNQVFQRIGEALPKTIQNQPQNIHQNLPPNVLQSIAKNIIPQEPNPTPYSKPPTANPNLIPHNYQINIKSTQQIKYYQNDYETYTKTLQQKQRQVTQMLQKSKMLNRHPYQIQNQYGPSKNELYRNNSQKKIVRMRADQIDDVSKIHKLSDAVKYKEFKKSRSRLDLDRY